MADPLSGLLAQTYFGNTLLQIALFFITAGISIIVGKIVKYMIDKYGKKLTAKSKSPIDDVILEIIEKPVVIIVFIMGIVIGFQFLTVDPGIAVLFSNVISVLFIIVIAWTLIKSVDKILSEIIHPMVAKTDSKLDDHLLPIVGKVSKAIILLIALLTMVSMFGFDITAVLAGLGIGGLAFAFAAKETIADVFGGFSIFTSRPFVTGDRIKAMGLEGTVTEVGLRYTRIKNLDGRIVVIPNSKLAGSVIENVSSEKARKISTTLTLVYGTPSAKLEEAREILKNILASHENILPDPTIYFKEFSSSSLDIGLMYYIKEKAWANITKAVNGINSEIKTEFEKAGLDFAYPTQTVYLEK